MELLQSPHAASARAYEFAMALLSECTVPADDQANQLLNTVHRICLQRMAERITVEDLAQQMKMRRDVFSRKFKADTGISPKRFFHRLLVDRATQLLRMPDITAQEVAFQLNFSSEYYFSRFFKQHLGISPHRFQQQYRIRKMV